MKKTLVSGLGIHSVGCKGGGYSETDGDTQNYYPFAQISAWLIKSKFEGGGKWLSWIPGGCRGRGCLHTCKLDEGGMCVGGLWSN